MTVRASLLFLVSTGTVHPKPGAVLFSPDHFIAFFSQFQNRIEQKTLWWNRIKGYLNLPLRSIPTEMRPLPDTLKQEENNSDER